MITRKEKAVELFKKGYTCSQAVLGAYCDVFGLDEQTAFKISCPFGGGMGRMRMVCGAFSGMLMVAGLYNGMTDGSAVGKKENYDLVNKLAEEFKKRNKGTLNCTIGIEKDKNGKIVTAPGDRTDEYYKKRPCIAIIEEAVDIIDKMIMPLVDDKYESVNFVRLNSEADITRAADMADEALKDNFKEIYTDLQIQTFIDRTQSCDMITSHMVNNGCEYYLVTNGDEVIGYCGVLAEAQAMNIVAMCVNKEHRNMGYGRSMLDVISTIAAKDKLDKISISCSVDLKESLQILKSLGFVEKGMYEEHFGDELTVKIQNLQLDI